MSSPGVVIFHPTLDTHYENFHPLYLALAETARCRPVFLRTPDLVPAGREIRWDPSLADAIHLERSDQPGGAVNAKMHVRLASAASQAINPYLESPQKGIVVVVGNDDSVFAKQFLRAARRRGARSVLLQDGWLESRNLIRTVDRSRWGRSAGMLRRIESILSSPYSPMEKLRGSGIGSNVDYVAAYSEAAVEEFEKAGASRDRLFVTGSPRHTLLRERVAAIRERDGGGRHWLVLPTGVLKPAHVAATLDAVGWVLRHDPERARPMLVKLHPRSNEADFGGLFEHEHVRLVDRHGEMAPVWASTELAFTFGSTSTIDALAAGVPVVELAPEALREPFGNLHSAVPQVDSPSKLKVAIDRGLAQDRVGLEYLIADCDPGWNSITQTSQLLLRLMETSAERPIDMKSR